MLKVLEGGHGDQSEPEMDLDALARGGARRMIAAAMEAEVAEYVALHRGERDEEGRALVVRNGWARPRRVTLGAGTVEIKAPRVHDRREGEKFTSRILPPYMRRSAKVAETLPILYLRGLSTGMCARRSRGSSARMQRGCRRRISPGCWGCGRRSRRRFGAAIETGCTGS